MAEMASKGVFRCIPVLYCARNVICAQFYYYEFYY